jgi:hypothetical protein
MNTNMTLLTEATKTQVLCHKTGKVLGVAGELAVGGTKAIATGFWSGCVRGWNSGAKAKKPAVKYLIDEQGTIYEVPA